MTLIAIQTARKKLSITWEVAPETAASPLFAGAGDLLKFTIVHSLYVSYHLIASKFLKAFYLFRMTVYRLPMKSLLSNLITGASGSRRRRMKQFQDLGFSDSFTMNSVRMTVIRDWPIRILFLFVLSILLKRDVIGIRSESIARKCPDCCIL